MNSQERFERPASYIVEKLRNAQFKSPDGEHIIYSPVCSGEERAHFKITVDGIEVTKHGNADKRVLTEIGECHEALIRESKYHPIKCAVLQTPRPVCVRLGFYDDKEDYLIFGGSEMTPMFRIFGCGHLQRIDFSDVPSTTDENYAWLLTRYIVMAYDSRKSRDRV